MLLKNALPRLGLLMLVLLCFTATAFSQQKQDLVFTPLDTSKIINNKQFVAQYSIFLKTGEPNSFIAKNKLIKQVGVDSSNCLAIKVAANKWVVYKLPIVEDFLNPNETEPIPAKVEGRFFIYTKHNPSSQSGVIYYRTDEFIIDVKRRTFLKLTVQSHYEYYAKDPVQRKGETYAHFQKRASQVQTTYDEVNTSITLNGPILTLKTLFERNGKKYYPPFSEKLFADDSEPLDLGGVYKYTNGVFVKIKTYKWGFKGLQPVTVLAK